MYNIGNQSHSPPIEGAMKLIKDEATLSELNTKLAHVGRSRDKQAFAFIFKWFAPKIIAYGIKTFTNEAVAKELLQECMTKVWRKAHLFDANKGAATTWIYSIMRNLSFDMLRKIQTNKEDNLSEDLWPQVTDGHSTDESYFPDHLEQQQLVDHLGLLPESQKQIIEGVYFKELTQAQIAEQLDIPIGTVKSRLRLALARLSQQIGDKS